MATHKPLTVIQCSYYFGALTENWIYNQVLQLNNNTLNKVYCVRRQNKDAFPYNDIRCLEEDLSRLLLHFNKICNIFFYFYPHFFFWIWKDKPDLIHAHFGDWAYFMLPYARLFKIPLAVSFYGFDAYMLTQHTIWRIRYKKLFKEASVFIVEGPAMCKRLIGLGCPPEKIIIHHIGIKVEEYEFHVRKPDDKIKLLVCARFVEKKGIPYAIEALHLLRKRTSLDVLLTIVGDSTGEKACLDEKKKILNTVDKYKLSNDVTFLGFVGHDLLKKIIYDHHILIAPSITASNGDAEGGFPVVLTEALATGMPAVGFDHCDIPYIIQNEKSGFVVPQRDIKALAERIVYLIEHPDALATMGSFGRNWVQEQYDINKLSIRLRKIYESLIRI